MLQSASGSSGKTSNAKQKLLARKRTCRRFVSKPEMIIETHFENLGSIEYKRQSEKQGLV